MATFIGSPIALTSIRGIRYRGILTKIDHAESTIGLSSVYSMGTEDRAPPDEFIPPQEQPYDHILFRASEVANLALDMQPRPQPRSIVQDDPAVIATLAPPASAPSPVQPTVTAPPPQVPAPSLPPVNTPRQPLPAAAPAETSRPTPPAAPRSVVVPKIATSSAGPRQGNDTPPVRSASASMETVERAINDLRISNNAPNTENSGPHNNSNVQNDHQHRRRSGRRARGPSGGAQPRAQQAIPAEDFDFARANSKFDKAALFEDNAQGSTSSVPVPQSPLEPGEIPEEPTQLAAQAKFYDKSRSFFDDISSDSKAKRTGEGINGAVSRGRGGGDGHGRGGRGRARRDEERSKNLSTFGEAATGPAGIGGGFQQVPGGTGNQGGNSYRGRRRRPPPANGGSAQPGGRREPAQQAAA